MPSASSIIRRLRLRPLPLEGGYFRETWRSSRKVPASGRSRGPRSAGTAIYYLLTSNTRSVLHRLPGPETWHFYLGDPVRLLLLGPGGTSRIVTLGSNLLSGRHPQYTVPACIWQGAALVPGGRFALLGTTMAPGYDDRDWEPGRRNRLCRRYPSRRRLILRLTPDC